MSFLRVAKLCVAAGLVMNLKARFQQRAKHFLRLEYRQTRRHLDAESYTQFFFAGGLLVGNRLAIFQKSLEVAADCVSSHRAGFLKGSPISNQAREKWNSNLVARLGLNLVRGRFSAVMTTHPPPHGFKYGRESVFTRSSFP